MLGYQPLVPIEDGIGELAAWLREQSADQRVAEASRVVAMRGLTA